MGPATGRMKLLMAGVDIAIAMLLILACGLLFGREPAYFIVQYPEVLAMPFFFLFFLYLGEFYSTKMIRRPAGIFYRALAMTGLATIFFHLFHTMTSNSTGLGGLTVILAFGTAIGAVAVRSVLIPVLPGARQAQRALIFGAGWSGRQIAETLKRKPWVGITPIGLIDDDPDKRNDTYKDLCVLGDCGSLRDTVERNDVTVIINTADRAKSDELTQSARNGSGRSVTVIDMPGFYEQITGKLLLREEGASWSMPKEMKECAPPLQRRRLKRAFDIIFAAVALILAFPVVALIVLLIKVSSRGPLFEREERIGEGAKPIYLLRFRASTSSGGDGGRTGWYSTAVGKLLHRTGLKEIALLINVLRGDVSFFGPLPEDPAHVEEEVLKNPHYLKRFSVKPGLLSWAEVNICDGGASKEATEKLAYDLYYVKNMSGGLDMKILARSCKLAAFSSLTT